MAWHPTWNDDDNSSAGGGGRYRHVRVQFGSPQYRTGQATKWLLIANIAVYVLVYFLGQTWLVEWGALTARLTLRHFQLWRLVTYQFLHAGAIDHILWNMLILWMFGKVVEMQFGTRRFLWLYILSGIAGGVCEISVNYLISTYGNWALIDPAMISIVGASAAVSGVVVAYALLNPNSTIYIMFIFPVKAKWAAIGIAAVTTLQALYSFKSGDNIAHWAHLGGMVYAFLWFKAGAHVPQGLWSRFKRTFAGLDADNRPSSQGTWRHPVTGMRTPQDNADDRRLDEILRKVHEQGIASLTDAERDFLRRMSEKKRDDVDFDNRHRL
jgi:membrane associated rhomboid family serine protease